jgi:Flp pilus assembly pilin Flp
MLTRFWPTPDLQRMGDKMSVWFDRFRRDRGGATVLEYALLLALAGVAALQQVGKPQQAAYEKVDTTIQKAAEPAFGEIK